MTPFAIAGLQLQLSGRHSNLDHIVDRLNMLLYLYPWVQMVVISELATYGGWRGHAMPLPCDAEHAYQKLAAKHGIWLVPGSFFEKTDSGIYNTAPVMNPGGEIVARYRKMFPFMPYETGVECGSEFCTFDVPDVGRFGVSICYDMWFPETSRTLASLGVEVILHPTLTASIDRDVELAIARATAATNQCFVIDVNGVGDGGIGRSIIVGPAGEVMYKAGTSEEMIPLEIDLDRVRRSREFGLRGLGQPLKSFRDSTVDFDVYQRSPGTRAYLETLGPLALPERGSRAGLGPPEVSAPESDAPAPDAPAPDTLTPPAEVPAAPPPTAPAASEGHGRLQA